MDSVVSMIRWQVSPSVLGLERMFLVRLAYPDIWR